MPDEKILQGLYNALKSDPKYTGVGNDINEFKANISDPKISENLFKALSGDSNYKGVGNTFDEFQSALGLKKKDIWERDAVDFMESAKDYQPPSAPSSGELVSTGATSESPLEKPKKSEPTTWQDEYQSELSKVGVESIQAAKPEEKWLSSPSITGSGDIDGKIWEQTKNDPVAPPYVKTFMYERKLQELVKKANDEIDANPSKEAEILQKHKEERRHLALSVGMDVDENGFGKIPDLEAKRFADKTQWALSEYNKEQAEKSKDDYLGALTTNLGAAIYNAVRTKPEEINVVIYWALAEYYP